MPAELPLAIPLCSTAHVSRTTVKRTPPLRSGIFAVALIVVAVALLAPLAGAQSPRGEIRSARRPIPNQYIVVLEGADDPDAMALASEALSGGRLMHVYRHAIRGFAIRMTPERAAALARDPRVASVEEDGAVAADLAESPAPWGLDRIDQRALPLDGIYSYASPLRDVRVHVLDTGIRTSHLEFGGRAFIAGDYIDDDGDRDPNDVGNDDADAARPDGSDCNGHGTHVAATIAGATYGVSKHASLLSYRVLDCSGNGTVSGVLAGIDAVTADRYRPAVANMSLGGDVSETLDAAVRTSIAAGITYVVAAGNDAVDAASQSPARVAEAMTVGATSSSDARASFSNFGPLVDLFAPGVSIPSAWYSSDSAGAILSGTSMAAPHVAGAAALYLEQMPAASPANVRNALVSAATSGVVVSAGTGSPNLLLYSAIAVTAPSGTSSLPSPWMTVDVGGVGATGNASLASGIFTIDGAGADIWGSADAFRFVYQPLGGDGTIVARIGGVQNVASWTKAAVMIRDSLAAGAVNATMLVSAAKGLSFQRRTTPGGASIATLAPGAAPAWIKLARLGTTLSAYRSSDGATWTLVDRATISMPRDVLIGLAVSSHVSGQLARATFTDVTVSGPGDQVGATAFRTLDVGAVGLPGFAASNPDTSYTIAGAGADVWGNADAFRYMYQQVNGDWDIEARIKTVDPVQPWTKAGVMIRETLRPDSRHAFALVSAAKGIAFQYRGVTSGASAQAGIAAGVASSWVKLSRRGSQLSAFMKRDGATSWQPLGTASIAMSSSIYVGIAVTSHDAGRIATAGIDAIRLTASLSQ
jgi:subtilisin family serine protease